MTNGDVQSNYPSVLPDNLQDVLLEYGRQVSGAALQNIALDQVVIDVDYETIKARYVGCTLTSASDDSIYVILIVQIAPSFRLITVKNVSTANIADDTAGDPPIE